MEGLDRFNASTQTDGRRESRGAPGASLRQPPQTGNRITIGAETQAESAMESSEGSASADAYGDCAFQGCSGGEAGGGNPGGGGRRRTPSKPPLARPRPPNPIERYIACFATARAAAAAAGVSTAMLRRMRVRGYVSTRHRALLMAQACRFKIQPVELLALTLRDE